MTSSNGFLSPNDIEEVPRTPPPPKANDTPVTPSPSPRPEALENLIFAQQKVCPDEYPRKIQFHIASIEALEGGRGRLNFHPSLSISVGVVGSTSEPFTTDHVKCGPTVNWNSNTPPFVVNESSQIRFELHYHPVLKKKPKSLGSITLSVPELVLKAPKGSQRESFVEYQIPITSSSEGRSSSESDRSQRNSQHIKSGEGPILKFSIRDLMASGAASDLLSCVKSPRPSIGDTASR